MAEPASLLLALESLALWGWQRDWQGRHLLVSAGPTREWLDPARCMSNPSTGRMGVLLAQAARLRGAKVDLVHGPLQVEPAWLEGLRCHSVETGAELQRSLEELQPQASAIAMAAAVADHRPKQRFSEKPDKQALADAMGAGWESVPDVLRALVERRTAGQAILTLRPTPAMSCRRPRPSLRARAVICCSPTPLTQRGPVSTASPTKAGSWAQERRWSALNRWGSSLWPTGC